MDSMGSATRAAAEKSRLHRAARTGPAPSFAAAGGSLGGGGGDPSALRKDRAGLKGKRGWAKKGGGGHGKYTWGVPGEDEPPTVSRADPNYDSLDEQEANVIFDVQDLHQQMARKAGISIEGMRGGGHLFGAPHASSAAAQLQAGAGRSALPPKLPLPELKRRAEQLVADYFVTEDAAELERGVRALQSPLLLYEFVRRAVTLAMQRAARECELVSTALAGMHGSRALSAAQVGKGFERLFELADDLALDVPLAKKLLAQFTARAVADEILPPSFLSDPLIAHIGGEVVERARVLLSMKHGLARLDNVWGPSAHSSVRELKQEIKMLLQEFLGSSDLDEACACVKKLGVPHFHHEVVKRAVVLALDAREREQAMMASLLAELAGREVVSQKQMEIGFRRLYQALPDMQLDAPGAAKILDVFLLQAVSDKCLSAAAAQQMQTQHDRPAGAPSPVRNP